MFVVSVKEFTVNSKNTIKYDKRTHVLVEGIPIKKHVLKWYPWMVEALKRDGFSCVKCGTKKGVIVHHLDESRKHGRTKMNNKLNNLMCLCRICHAKEHGYSLKINSNSYLIKELREQGKTFQEIGDHIGISRQRVHQLWEKMTH